MAAKKGSLRAVAEGERPLKPREIKSVLDAADNGTRLDELVQMRRVIARALDNEKTSARDLASLSRRQIEISREVEAIQRQMKEAADERVSTDDGGWSEEAI